MANESLNNLMRETALFATLGPVIQARVAESSGTLKFDRSRVIVDEGKQCTNLFIVSSGSLEVFKKIDENTDILIQTLVRGDTFGEIYLLDGAPTVAGLRAAENSVVACLDRAHLNAFIKDNPEFSRTFIRYISSRSREIMVREQILLKELLSSDATLPENYSLKNPNAVQEEIAHPLIGGESKLNEQEEDSEPGDDMFFKKEFTCPLCASVFRTSKPRQKFVVAEKIDEDFCVHYKHVNPIYYEINVCPKCGYSYNNSTSAPIRAELKKGILKAVSELWNGNNYCATRSLEDTVETFKLAMECQRLRGSDDYATGRFYLKLGWLYRYMNNKTEELKHLEKALEYLSKAFEREQTEDPKEIINLMFLLGQLSLILENEKEAVNWFIRITQHPGRTSYPYIANRARGMWQEIRQRRKAEGK